MLFRSDEFQSKIITTKSEYLLHCLRESCRRLRGGARPTATAVDGVAATGMAATGMAAGSDATGFSAAGMAAAGMATGIAAAGIAAAGIAAAKSRHRHRESRVEHDNNAGEVTLTLTLCCP